jgi:dienelactone hydrolase
MPGQMVEFAANGSTANGYLSRPGSGSGPGVIVIQEWWGLVDHIKAVADRFASEGFVALAPDLYHGESTTSPDDAGRLMICWAQAGRAQGALASWGSAWGDSSRLPRPARLRRSARASTSTAYTRT